MSSIVPNDIQRVISFAADLESRYLSEKIRSFGGHFKFPGGDRPVAAFRDGGVTRCLPCAGIELSPDDDFLMIYFFQEDGQVLQICEPRKECFNELLPGEMMLLARALPEVPFDIDEDAHLWELLNGNWELEEIGETVHFDKNKQTISSRERRFSGIKAWEIVKTIGLKHEKRMPLQEAVLEFAKDENLDLPF